MASRVIIADNQKMFVDGLQAIISEVNEAPIRIVGLVYTLEELKSCLDFSFDLLILEPALADTEGLQLIEDIKSERPDIKIIVLSNYGEAKIVKNAFLKGVDGYVLKNTHAIEFLNCVDRVIEGHTYIGEGLRLTPEFSKSKKQAKTNTGLTQVFQDRLILKSKLTKREKQILTLVVQFKSNKEIAQELYISDQTVSVHRKKIMKKFGVTGTVNLIKFAMDHHLV